MTYAWLKEKKIHLMMLAGSLFIAWMFSSGAMPTTHQGTPQKVTCPHADGIQGPCPAQ